MKKHDFVALGLLLALAGFIWFRDTRWWDAAGDSLPLLAALPLFIWLRRPWQPRARGWRLHRGWLAAALTLFPLGIAFDSGLVLACGWTALLASWVQGRFVAPEGAATRQLLILPLLAFPWMITDLETIAWWFRLSGAAVTEQLMSLGSFPVVREGTYLSVNGFGVSVEPACSGVNGLQSMLVAGGAIAYWKLRGSALFWWNLPVLVGAAWLANLLRIVTATACGAFLAPETAAKWVDPVHSFAGWLALCLVFLLCCGVFAAQARWLARPRRAAGADSPWLRLPWAEITLVAYGAWVTRGLWETWIWTPYDRLGWLAFFLWLLPVLWPGAAAWRGALSLWTRRLVLGAAVGFFLLGAAADINALHHAGLAAVIVSFARRPGYVFWAAGAIAWMPAAGWFGSRLGLDPAQFAVCRVLVAALAAAWGLGVLRQELVARRPLQPSQSA